MDRKTLSVLLIEDSPDYAGLVQQWLSTAGDEIAFVLNWTDSLAAGLNRLAQGGLDVVLLDLGLPDSDGLETFLTTRAHAPGMPIVILSAADSESLALQMIQQGAEDYLVKSSCNAELLVRAVRHAVVRRRWQVSQASAAASSERARVIGVLGAKGGVGATTVACGLAAELRRQTGPEVLLADLDVNGGQVSFLMAVDPKYSILDAISNIDRLDRTCWDAIVTHGVHDLHIISSPSLLGNGDLPSDGVREVLTLIRPFYNWTVIDLGRLEGMSRSLLDKVDELFVVTTTGIPALYQTKRAVDALIKAGMKGDRLRLIVNQAEDGHALSGRDFTKLFGIPVYARLPRDSHHLNQACIQKRLPRENSNVGRRIASLARNVAGLREQPPRKNPPGLFSLVEKFRRTGEGAPTQAG